MTTARERFGFLTGALIAILIVGLLGAWAMRPAEEPGGLGKAGIPATDADTTPGVDANEEREEQAEGVERRVEAWEEALRQGKAGQAGKRTYLQGAAAPATTGWAGELP